MNTYWISFVGDEGQRGVCIVDASDQEHALDRAKQLGIHPGGEAMLYEMPEEAADEIRTWGKDRLIRPDELKEAGYRKLGDCTEEQIERIENHPRVSRACEKHS